MIVPEADQVNTSICPGVSIKTYLSQERPLKKYYPCGMLKIFHHTKHQTSGYNNNNNNKNVTGIDKDVEKLEL